MKHFLILLLCIPSFLYSQNIQVDSLELLLKTTTNTSEVSKINLQLAKIYERIDIKKGKDYAYKAYVFKTNDSILAETNNQIGRLHFFSGQLDSASHYFENTKIIFLKLKDKKRVAIINISLGAIQLRLGDYVKTITTLTESASFFEETKDDLNAAKCYSNIATAFAELNNYEKAITYSKKALEVFNKNSLTQFQLITLPNLATQYFKSGDTLKAINYYNEAETLALQLNSKRSLSLIYNNLGSIYLESNSNKAKDYLEKSLRLKKELNLESGVEITQSNLGYINLKNRNYKKAIYYLEEAKSRLKGTQLIELYNYLSESYKGIDNLNKALEFSERSRFLNDSILNSENQKIILDIQTKYETEKKEKEILQLQTDNLNAHYLRKQNQNLLIAALVALVITLYSLYLFRKNTKRKRIIMEQNLIIQEQEFNQILKSQELEGIDAIIDAQEKERSKIAIDLHDNLGSKIATLKLYLESFNDKENFSNFYSKLKNLINETYNEIRNISKNKNFGASINKGLIPSTKAIAKQISNTEKIDIKVITVDINKLIENTVEIQIFRVIQELLTNVIKHADATETVIQFSEHENILNIIVEDNGNGFDINKTFDGIGLINIEKRIEKIDGELVIDSSKGNGTTVIINIPI